LMRGRMVLAPAMAVHTVRKCIDRSNSSFPPRRVNNLRIPSQGSSRRTASSRRLPLFTFTSSRLLFTCRSDRFDNIWRDPWHSKPSS
ncbi:hypothetical protein PMAYCL1PPCAC_06130, partial [Pristionchus mayeri]